MVRGSILDQGKRTLRTTVLLTAGEWQSAMRRASSVPHGYRSPVSPLRVRRCVALFKRLGMWAANGAAPHKPERACRHAIYTGLWPKTPQHCRMTARTCARWSAASSRIAHSERGRANQATLIPTSAPMVGSRFLPIRLLPTPPTCRMLPGSGVKLCVGKVR